MAESIPSAEEPVNVSQVCQSVKEISDMVSTGQPECDPSVLADVVFPLIPFNNAPLNIPRSEIQEPKAEKRTEVHQLHCSEGIMDQPTATIAEPQLLHGWANVLRKRCH